MNRKRHSKTASSETRGLDRREIGAIIGGFVVGLNLFLNLLVGISATANTPMLREIAGDNIVICTGSGVIVLDREGRPVEQKDGAADALCPFCLPFLQGHVQTPAAVAIPVVASYAQPIDVPPYIVARPTPARLASSGQPRAPPFA